MFEEYLEFVRSLTNWSLTSEDLLIRDGIKLSTEGSEILDTMEKHRFQGHPINRDKLIEEMGDLMYYLVHLCGELGITLDDVMENNIAKLKRRYPTGKFTPEDSISRRDQTEDRVIESSKHDYFSAFPGIFNSSNLLGLHQSREEGVSEKTSTGDETLSKETSQDIPSEKVSNAELVPVKFIKLDPVTLKSGETFEVHGLHLTMKDGEYILLDLPDKPGLYQTELPDLPRVGEDIDD